MPAISRIGPGTVVSAVKTAAVVMVLTLCVSVAGFVTPAVPTAPAAAQNNECVSTTVIALTTGESTTRTDCYETGTTDLDGDLPLGHVWCSVTFGDYYWGSTPNAEHLIAAHIAGLSLAVAHGIEWNPAAYGLEWGCSKRDPALAYGCVMYQGGMWDRGHGVFTTIRDLDNNPLSRKAPKPWTGSGENCLTTNHIITADDVLEIVINDVCNGRHVQPRYVEFYAVQTLSNDLANPKKSETVRLEGDVLDFDDCCPKSWEHNDGDPGETCHSHLRPPCQTGTTVTYYRINGDGHTGPFTVAPCPNPTSTPVGAPDVTPVGATFDIVLDYPRRGQGVFATIGGALAPVTFTATAKNFVCRAPSPCGDPAAGRTVPISVSFDQDLEGLNGYIEHPDGNFEEFSETVDASRNGVDRWGRLDYSREIVAYFYRATYTGDGTSANPEQRVAINITDLNSNTGIKGTYQYSVFETVNYWIPDPDDPVDGGFWLPVTETRNYQAPMTARLVDVDGDPISGDPYYSRENGRVELRIAGFQPVFD